MVRAIAAGSTMMALVVGSVSGPQPAQAHVSAQDGGEEDMERARQLYREARTAYERGKFVEAAENFELAYDLAGDPNLLFNLALVYERMDELERALEYLRRYRRLAPPEEHEALDGRIDGMRMRIEETPTRPPKPEAEDPRPPRRKDPGDAIEAPERPRVFNGLAIGLTAGASAFLVAGAALGAVSLGQTRQMRPDCPELDGDRFCLGRTEDRLRSSRRLAIASDVTLGVGAALGVAALVVIALRIKQRRSGAQETAQVSRWRVSGAGISAKF